MEEDDTYLKLAINKLVWELADGSMTLDRAELLAVQIFELFEVAREDVQNKMRF